MNYKKILSGAFLFTAVVLILRTCSKDESGVWVTGSQRITQKNGETIKESGIAGAATTASKNIEGSDFRASGSVHLSDKNLQSLACSGSVKLIKVTVEKNAQVSGSLRVESGSFNTLAMSGTATLTDTKAQNVVLSGSLTATNSTLNKIETSRTSRLTLTNCTVESIFIKDGGSTEEPKPIEIYGGVVTGDITFEHKDGKSNRTGLTVILHNNAQLKGNVVGGIIIKR